MLLNFLRIMKLCDGVTLYLHFTAPLQNAALRKRTLMISRTLLCSSPSSRMPRHIYIWEHCKLQSYYLQLHTVRGHFIVVRLTLAMYQPISFIGLVNGRHRLSFSSTCPSHSHAMALLSHFFLMGKLSAC